MVDKDPVGGNPLAVLIVALVVWIAFRLVRGLLDQAGVSLDRVNTSTEWEPGDDDAGHHHGGWGGHAGDAGHGGDGGGDGGH